MNNNSRSLKLGMIFYLVRSNTISDEFVGAKGRHESEKIHNVMPKMAGITLNET